MNFEVLSIKRLSTEKMNIQLSFNYFILLATAIFFISCEEENKEVAQELKSLPIIQVERGNVTTFKNYPASFEGVVSSEVRAKVSGYITDVLIDEGKEVNKGQVLFRLETESLDQQAKAAKARVEVARVEMEKIKPLVEKNIVSEIQLETAKANFEDAMSNFESVRANINYANITSPVNGVIGRINYRNGSLVSPTDLMPLTRVAQIDEVFVYFSMNEKDFLDFVSEAKGNNIQEKIEALPEIELILSNGRVFKNKGRIEAISGEVNPTTGSVSFRARFKNDGGIIRDGGSGRVRIPTFYEDKLVIPIVSTFERQNKTFVYRIVKDSLVENVISIENATDQVYVLKNGFEEGDYILGKGANRVKDGEIINPQKTSMEDILSSYETVFR